MKEKEKGFTLIEVMMVVVIIAILSSIVVPRLLDSAKIARQNADIATGHQIKMALDRYFVENGHYPTSTSLVSSSGAIADAGFIPDYIAKLDKTITQQQVAEANRGFGKLDFSDAGNIPSTDPDHLIMIYVNADGSKAEVRTYASDLKTILWSSLD